MRLFLVFIVLFLLTGCGKEDYIVCTIDLENVKDDYKLNSEYKIYYKDSFVTRIEKVDEYYSLSDNILKYFNESKSLEYEKLNSDYGGYEFEIIKNNDNLKIISNIDIEKVDIEKMVKDKYLNKYYVNSNRLTLGGIKYFYEAKGANCDI